MSNFFELCYWVRGQPTTRVALIDISRTATISTLQKLLKGSEENTFRAQNLGSVILSELGNPFPPSCELSDVFPAPPLEYHLHIIVDAPFPSIFFWLQGKEEVENCSAIAVSANTKISQLVKQIKGKQSDLSAVHDVCMHLYKVATDDDCELQENLHNPGTGDCLDGRQLVSTSFLDVPVLQNYYVIFEITTEREADIAVTMLNQEHSDLFHSLQITVMKLKGWSKEDVVYNMKGGDFWSHGEVRSDVITNLERELADRCTYNSSVDRDDLKNAHNKDATRFEGSFLITNAVTCSVKDKREFIPFFNVLRCHVKYAQQIADDRSSHLKAATCLMHFMVPPFFSSLPPVQPYRLRV
ncbi:hypothetical protein BS17DRAFT_788291 [Gyrodon lividus]|nr:hypothetical protein BS17DRAFT_788291 [Gyrodon lividus]